MNKYNNLLNKEFSMHFTNLNYDRVFHHNRYYENYLPYLNKKYISEKDFNETFLTPGLTDEMIKIICGEKFKIIKIKIIDNEWARLETNLSDDSFAIGIKFLDILNLNFKKTLDID